MANVPEDELGNAYEYLIKKFADDSGHTAAEFYTNCTAVHLMTQLLSPQVAASIYDPTCGTGGMLISALDEVKRSGGEYRTLKLYGHDPHLPHFPAIRIHVSSAGGTKEKSSLIRSHGRIMHPPYSENPDRFAQPSHRSPWSRKAMLQAYGHNK